MIRPSAAVGSYQLMEVLLEKFHGIDKVTLSRRHDHVYRVEVFLTIKTSPQVGFWISGGV
jgi:hypothetical protein